MKIFLAIPLLFLAISCGAQKENASKNSDEGLVWHTDMNQAIAISQKENKPMMLFFTGSDWCGWCIRLQKEVFLTETFTKWAKENVVLVELDFPRSKPQTDAI
jgi:thioredoxin-related protein